MARPGADRRWQGPALGRAETLTELGIDDVPLVAIAKAQTATPARTVLPARPACLPDAGARSGAVLPPTPARRGPSLCHRHPPRQAVGSDQEEPLDDVPGIGPRRKKALLLHFGSARSVSRASVADLLTVEGIETVAQKIYDHFHRNDPSDAARPQRPDALRLLTAPVIGALLLLVALGAGRQRCGCRWRWGCFCSPASPTSPTACWRGAGGEQAGAVLDPVADKLLMLCTGLGLVVLVPDLALAGAVLLMLARDLAVGGLRELALSRGRRLPVAGLGKAKTVLRAWPLPLGCRGRTDGAGRRCHAGRINHRPVLAGGRSQPCQRDTLRARAPQRGLSHAG